MVRVAGFGRLRPVRADNCFCQSGLRGGGERFGDQALVSDDAGVDERFSRKASANF